GPASGSFEAADAVSLLAGARQALEAVAEHDPALAGLAGRLSEASYLVSDVAAELASYVQSVDSDPARLAAVQERRAELTRLIRTYGGLVPGPAAGPDGAAAVPDLSAVLGWAKQAGSRLTELEGDDDRIATLADEEARLAAAVAELAGQLTELRRAAAEAFAAGVTAELSALAMPHARLAVAGAPARDVGPRGGGRAGDFGPHGADEVEIRLAAHPGAPMLPLSKGASGGELSRVMLAIEVVFAGADPVPTFVFDEVDAGVGGRAAVEVGRRLARLARLAQGSVGPG